MNIIEKNAYSKIYENDKCSIIYIKDYGAMKLFGAGTKWCIVNENAQRWKEYNKKYLFLVLVAKHTEEKLAMIYTKKYISKYTNYENHYDALAVFSERDNKVSNRIVYFDFDLDKRGYDTEWVKGEKENISENPTDLTLGLKLDAVIRVFFEHA